MKGIIISIVVGLICAATGIIQAQYPSYFQITTEEGLPSNEVYSLVEDSQGFIWLGCDAGLFKYDGIRFIPFKNKNLQSKSITGLTVSKSGRIYCYTFKGQLFYVENNKMFELNHSLTSISHIVCDEEGNLWINHLNGLSMYNENTENWKDFTNFSFEKFNYTNSGFVDKLNQYWFVNEGGLSLIKKGKLIHYEFDYKTINSLSGNFFFASNSPENNWFISRINGIIYTISEQNKLIEYKDDTLIELLKSRKINNIIPLSDNELWICTYTGIIKYDIKLKTAILWYPYLAFSNCIKDSSGTIWLSTLQNGIIRIPNPSNQVWNSKNKGIQHDLLNKIAGNKDAIYFASLDGFVGVLDKKNENVSIIANEVQGDIQQMYFDTNTKLLYYSINNSLYTYSNGKVTTVNTSVFPLKCMLKVDDSFILATSFGCYATNNIANLDSSQILNSNWSRTLNWISKSKKLWIGTNNGLFLYQKKGDLWKQQHQLLDSTQIVTTELDTVNELLYAITFEGKIYAIDKNNKLIYLNQLNESVQANQITLDENRLYITTNSGLWIWNINEKYWTNITKNNGLASNNIQSILIDESFLWLTTGNGLQKISKDNFPYGKKSRLYLKQLLINGKVYKEYNNIQMDYKHAIAFQLESTNYTSNGNFKYAYRIKTIDTNWIYFPGSIEQIELLKLPSGPFEIEIKSIDVFGNDSENTILLKGNVNPPFWQKWWFFILIISFVLLISWMIFKLRIKTIRKNQRKEIEHIQLENELRLTQQAALKAQMNPHFLFNVLNSIKGYIYDNDKKNAVNYLNNFSELVRKVLTLSSLPIVKLKDEIEVLELYIQLEAMLLDGEFEFTKKIDSDFDIDTVEIPSLIIQPYIENAFKHGLRHKRGKKILQLKIQLDQKEEILSVEITDNGIGRVASYELNSHTKQHDSFATKANEKRIDLLNYKKSGIIGVSVIDLNQNEHKTVGTRVILKIHLQNGSNK